MSSPESDPSIVQPGGLAVLPRINGARSVLAGWRDLAAGIHAYGAHLFENVRNPFARAIDVEERTVELAADLVVFATGLARNDALYHACVDMRVAPEIHNVGDSFKIGRIFDATTAGYAVASAL